MSGCRRAPTSTTSARSTTSSRRCAGAALRNCSRRSTSTTPQIAGWARIRRACGRRKAARSSSAPTAWKRPRFSQAPRNLAISRGPLARQARSGSCPRDVRWRSATWPSSGAVRASRPAESFASCRRCRTSTWQSWGTTMSWLSLDRHKVELVARRDLRDATSELRLVLAMVALTVAIPIGSAIGIRSLAYFGGGTAVVNRLAVVGAFFVVFIPASFSLVLALEAFVGERERTTLEVLLSTPLKEAEIYVGKVAAVLVVSLGLCYGGLVVYCLAVFPGLGYFPLAVLVALALSTICQVAAMVAGAVIISLIARTMRAANVMASFIILPMSIVLQVEAALILIGRPEFLWGFAALMIVLAAVLLRMGLAGFSREALLAREVGLRKPLQRAMAAVRWSFGGRPGIVRLVCLRRWPVALAALGFAGGAGVGVLAGKTAAIPGAVVKPVISSLISASAAATQSQEIIGIFGHNLLAFLLAGVLAVFTAGLSGFALTFLPGFLLGYAAALSSWTVALGGIFPNGVVEIPAAIVAGGLVIQIGATAIHMEPEGGWTARVLAAFADYMRSLRWIVPALALAAILEVRFG